MGKVLCPARACRVEHGTAGLLGWLRLNRLQRVARLAVERQATMFVALAHDVDPPRPGPEAHRFPAESEPMFSGRESPSTAHRPGLLRGCCLQFADERRAYRGGPAYSTLASV